MFRRKLEPPSSTTAKQRTIPEDAVKNLKSYIGFTGWTLLEKCNVSPVRNELGFYIPEDGIIHSHRLENLKSYTALTGCAL
jgi:hypothetical protein